MKCGAVILAGGKGKRMWPLSETRSKVALPLVGRPLLHYVLDTASRITDKVCVIVPGYNDTLKESIVQAASNYDRKKLKIKFVEQPQPLGTGNAVMLVEPYVDEHFLVMNGDILILDEVQVESPSMVVVRSSHTGEFGTPVIKDGVVVEIKEKEPGEAINGGVYLLPRDVFSVLDTLTPSVRGEYELTDAISRLGLQAVFVEKDKWMDVGRPWNLLEAVEKILDRMKPYSKGEILDGVKTRGKVIIEEGAVIDHGTVIEGPVYIGKNASIGPKAYIRPYSSIEEGAKVGHCAELKSSVVMENSKISHFSYVGDSVIGRNVNVGAGTVFANLRFDGKEVVKGRRKLGAIVGDNVKIGVNVSLMPGVRIGANSLIYPGIVVYRDVESNTFYRGEEGTGKV